MTHRFDLFLMALVIVGLLDALWLGVVMSALYRSQQSLIPRMSGNRLAPLWTPALLVYVLLAFGIVAFVLPRTPDEASIARGGLFGLVVYGVYDLSNVSSLKRAPVLLTAVDIAWGAVAAAATTWLVATGHRFLH
jgi:uncharacterized membrane protein